MHKKVKKRDINVDLVKIFKQSALKKWKKVFSKMYHPLNKHNSSILHCQEIFLW